MSFIPNQQRIVAACSNFDYIHIVGLSIHVYTCTNTIHCICDSKICPVCRWAPMLHHIHVQCICHRIHALSPRFIEGWGLRYPLRTNFGESKIPQLSGRSVPRLPYLSMGQLSPTHHPLPLHHHQTQILYETLFTSALN